MCDQTVRTELANRLSLDSSQRRKGSSRCRISSRPRTDVRAHGGLGGVGIVPQQPLHQGAVPTRLVPGAASRLS